MIPRWARNRLALFTVEAALACLMACSVAYAQSPAGPISDLISLEQINPEEYEPAVGEQIRVAYEEARRNPRDAETVGKLGMIFQCYGKYEPAETCYRRAWALAPRSFRWVYYLGNVEGWLGKYRDAVNHVREALQIEGNNSPATSSKARKPIGSRLDKTPVWLRRTWAWAVSWRHAGIGPAQSSPIAGPASLRRIMQPLTTPWAWHTGKPAMRPRPASTWRLIGACSNPHSPPKTR